MAIINFSEFTPGNLSHTVEVPSARKFVGDTQTVEFTVTDTTNSNTFTDHEFTIRAFTTEGGLIDLTGLGTGSNGTITGDVTWNRVHAVTGIEISGTDVDSLLDVTLPLAFPDGTTTPHTVTARPRTQKSDELLLANGFDTKVTVVLTIDTRIETIVMESGQVRVIENTNDVDSAFVTVSLPHTRGGGRGRVDDGDRLFAASYIF